MAQNVNLKKIKIYILACWFHRKICYSRQENASKLAQSDSHKLHGGTNKRVVISLWLIFILCGNYLPSLSHNVDPCQGIYSLCGVENMAFPFLFEYRMLVIIMVSGRSEVNLEWFLVSKTYFRTYVFFLILFLQI